MPKKAMVENNFWKVKKLLMGKSFSPQNESCLKLPELPMQKSHFQGGWVVHGRLHRQTWQRETIRRQGKFDAVAPRQNPRNVFHVKRIFEGKHIWLYEMSAKDSNRCKKNRCFFRMPRTNEPAFSKHASAEFQIQRERFVLTK